jgi:hypothetical protein
MGYALLVSIPVLLLAVATVDKCMCGVGSELGWLQIELRVTVVALVLLRFAVAKIRREVGPDWIAYLGILVVSPFIADGLLQFALWYLHENP